MAEIDVTARDIVVVGASAGGVEALMTMVRNLPVNFPAAVFVVLHLAAHSPSLLPGILNRSGHLPALHPVDGQPIEQGKIYIAPPDNHMLIENNTIRIVHGPKENRHRPAIDPLFRSAARYYGPRAIGVVLTGSLDDGTAGLLSIKNAGGVAVVQNPEEALYPSMPSSAIAHAAVDHIVSLNDLGSLLVWLVNEPVGKVEDDPESENLDRDIEIKEQTEGTASMDQENRPGEVSTFSCPDCGGVLWELKENGLVRYRCRVGHGYSVESMLAAQSDQLEEALWVALKTLEESISLTNRMAENAHKRGQHWLAQRYEVKAKEDRRRAETIQSVLMMNNLEQTDFSDTAS